ncbi:MAG TPA: hypothetical protein VJZ91_17530, partial [Blastocatellia bacterium]|nr:hypothetical protein [Blastocatellia bacterium]
MEDGDVRRIECEAVEVEKLKALAAERAARREALERVDLKELEMRLYLRAEAKLRTMRWRGAYGGKPPGGNKAMDFVQNAFTGFLEGKRTWDHCPETIFNVLADFIRADASRLANKAENSKTSRATSTPEDAGLDTADISSVAAPELSSPQVILEEQGKEQKLLSLFPEGSAERAVVEEII